MIKCKRQMIDASLEFQNDTREKEREQRRERETCDHAVFMFYETFD